MKKVLYTFLTWGLTALFMLTGFQFAYAGQSSAPFSTPQAEVVENPWAQMEDMAQTKWQKKMVRKLERKEARMIKKGKMTTGDRSWGIALLLSIFLGGLGIDRFYLGYTGWGLLRLFTGGLFGILYVLDIIFIAVGSLQPKNGSYVTPGKS